MLRSKIIDSKPRSPSIYTFCRDKCDAEVIGIITLKAHGVAFSSSHETHDWNTKQQAAKTGIQKKGGNQLAFILQLSLTTRRTKKKRRHVCSTLLPFMLFFAKTCSKASPPRTLVCSLSVQL
ncbi:hypothetical protein AVEN_205172-1 [Araneus ventricosus]|uniref:Uncharacterized protein n=1 Tax=Araneus ventricosus TaxID=182803 RepID=A0A4Y2P6Q6_ARAVE|nr:hypothetical protein AVEN_205172-1 [Araneus ventricosus]